MSKESKQDRQVVMVTGRTGEEYVNKLLAKGYTVHSMEGGGSGGFVLVYLVKDAHRRPQ